MQVFKTIASRAGKRPPASSRLLAVLVVAVPVMFAACGDDGNLLGSDNAAGSTSGGNAGNSNAAASGHAGAQTSAGANSGGSANTGGSADTGGSASAGHASGGAGSGGGPDCNLVECAVANVCLDHCGGNVVYTGCCRCDAGTVDQRSCNSAGGQGSGGQGNMGCVGETCSASQTCVGYRTVGGAVEPPSQNNTCPTGKHVEGNLCLADFGYTCAELTGCDAPAATCRCAADTECANTTVCRLPTASAWLDSSAELVCERQVP